MEVLPRVISYGQIEIPVDTGDGIISVYLDTNTGEARLACPHPSRGLSLCDKCGIKAGEVIAGLLRSYFSFQRQVDRLKAKLPGPISYEDEVRSILEESRNAPKLPKWEDMTEPRAAVP